MHSFSDSDVGWDRDGSGSPPRRVSLDESLSLRSGGGVRPGQSRALSRRVLRRLVLSLPAVCCAASPSRAE